MRQTFLSSPLFLSLSFYRFLVGCVYTSVHYLSLRRKSTFVFDLVSVCTRERANLIWDFSSSSLVVTEDWLRWKEAGENAVIWPFKKGLNLCCSSSIQLGPFYCQLSALFYSNELDEFIFFSSRAFFPLILSGELPLLAKCNQEEEEEGRQRTQEFDVSILYVSPSDFDFCLRSFEFNLNAAFWAIWYFFCQVCLLWGKMLAKIFSNCCLLACFSSSFFSR